MTSRCLCLVALLALPSVAPAQAALRLGDDGYRVGQPFTEAVLSPDGRVFALAGEFGDLFLLDAATGRLLRSWELAAPSISLAFAPDGMLLVLDNRGWVRTFDSASGWLRREVLVQHPLPGLPFRGRLFEGGRLVVYRDDTPQGQGRTALFDLRDARPLYRNPEREPELRRASTDGRYLVEVGTLPPASGEAAPREWLDVRDLDTGKTVSATLPLQGLQGVGFDDANRSILLVAAGSVYRIDRTTGKVLAVRLLEMDPAWHSTQVFFTPDGRGVVFRRLDRGDNNLGWWDTVKGTRQLLWSVPIVLADRFEWTTAGRLLAWNSGGLRLRVFDLRRGGGSPAPASGHRTPVFCLRWLPGGALLSADVQGRVCLWETATGRLKEHALLPGVPARERSHENPEDRLLEDPFPCGFDAAGRRLRYLHALAPRVCDWRTGKPADNEPPGGAPLTADLRWWRTAVPTKLLDTDTGRTRTVPAEATEWLGDGLNNVWAVASPDGDRLVLAQVVPSEGPTELVHFRLALLGTDRADCFELHVSRPTVPVFSADGRVLALGHDEEISLFEPGRARQSWRLPGATQTIAFTPDGRHLLIEAVEHDRPALLLVELATRTVARRWPLRGLLGSLAVFSPDGRSLAVPATDGTVVLLPTGLPPAPLDRADVWRDLGSADIGVALAATQALAALPDAERRIHARGLARPGSDAVSPLVVADLDDDDPERRDAARRALRGLSPAQLDALEASLPEPSPEVRRALAEARDAPHVSEDLPPCALRRLRLAQVLERLAAKPE